MIALSNRTDVAKFTKDNIAEYNDKHNSFTAKNLKNEIQAQLGINEDPAITDSDIGIYLNNRLLKLLSSLSRKAALDRQLNALSGSKDAIHQMLTRIANSKVLSLSDLEQYYESSILDRIKITYETNATFKNDLINRLLTYSSFLTPGSSFSSSSDQMNYVRNTLTHATDKALYLALSKGFTNRRVDINTGTKVANEGDSAQFLFLARAVLAGYTCSNVDVRSSRYDAIIDYEGKLLKVQIKGISGNSISLKDRDRGGAGIDPTDPRNKGKIISSKEIDLYVAVDKQFGICYIIPAIDIDSWTASGTFTRPISALIDYKENWENIAKVAKSLK